MKNDEKIDCEFGLWAVNRLVENQEFATVLLSHELEQLKSKLAESITAGNHNLELITAHKSDQ